MKKYNHAFDIAFSIITTAPCGILETDQYPSEEEIFEAIDKRITNLKNNPGDIFEAIGAPYDTYIEEE